jgi:Zn-dependent protease
MLLTGEQQKPFEDQTKPFANALTHIEEAAHCALTRFSRETYKRSLVLAKRKGRFFRMKCEVCGQETFLPFQCPYCNGHFCEAHRLPENHNCSRIDLARAPKQEGDVVVSRPATYEYRVTLGAPRQHKGRVYFSPKEVKHLTVAVLLVLAVGMLSFLYGSILPVASLAISVIAFTVILTVSFFIHEMAHKITAQRRGLWSEFRLTLWGSVVTLIFAFLPIKFISPGAVMIAGAADRKEIGEISIAGPIINILLSMLFLGTAFVSGPYFPIFLFGSFFNAYIAAFNLVPLGILDGQKIFSWSKTIWGLTFAISAALAAIGYIMYLPYLQ